MKRHNTVKVVLVTILVLMLLTWIFPAAYFQSSYVDQGRVQMGLFDLFSYPVTAISYFGFIAIFILVIGGFYAVLEKTGVYRLVLDKIVKKFKGKEKIVLSVIMVLLAVLTSVCGLQLPLLIFIPMLISIILLMGYDKIVAALTTVGGITVGLAGSTFAYNLTSVLIQALSIKVTSEIISKVVILVLGLVLLIYSTLKYADKHKKSKSKAKADFKLEDFVPEEVKGSKKKKVWPFILIVDLVFLIMILAFISWSGAFELNIFEDATTAVTGFKIAKFAIFGKILGTVNAFGTWTVSELSVVLVIASIILALIYKIKLNDYIQAMITGAKRALQPAVLAVLIYTCLVICTYHPFQLVIYDWLFNLTKGFNVATTTIVAALSGLFNVESLYSFQSSVPYLASLVSDKGTYPLIALIFQSMYGLMMLVAPTSVVLMCTLSYLNISYKEWLKNVWKIALKFLVILVIIFTVLVLI